ncbi:hypothetical protein HMPREF0762_00038 [Slackia exigua ATCC 700122]|uniref:Uncharacterized protein n=1 Tax=Slackia exigua (strain ATCC 700122 / DSM 15923 / CIP 105133 / JCM 11022 / KCTC 5966 / S-7) TaxID=649764 RepID=D0WE14_SLAES|nr:hypothetical protein HMPREF0762_00038 [Slackia exigua ATCC 700122]
MPLIRFIRVYLPRRRIIRQVYLGNQPHSIYVRLQAAPIFRGIEPRLP